MIAGVGVDIVEVERIAKQLGDSVFMKFVFHESELDEGERRGGDPRYFAGVFCAKEAFYKACAGMQQDSFVIADVVIGASESEDFEIVPGRKLQRILKGKKTRLSITQTEKHAMAIVIIELN